MANVVRIKNLKNGALVLNSGFAEPVTLQPKQEIDVTQEVMLNAEIQRLIQASVIGVVKKAVEKVVEKKAKAEKAHVADTNTVVVVTEKKKPVKEKVEKSSATTEKPAKTTKKTTKKSK